MDDTPKKTSKTKKHTRNIAIDLATLFVIGVVAVLIIVMLGQNQTTITSSGASVNVTGIYCSKSGVDNPFVSAKSTPESGLHEIRANFTDDALTDIMYSFTGTYAASADLSQAKTHLHADFDLAYGNVQVYRDNAWSANFSADPDAHQIKMSIYSESKNVRSSTAEAFMLGSSTAFPKTLSEVQSAYTSAGFSCQISKK